MIALAINPTKKIQLQLMSYKIWEKAQYMIDNSKKSCKIIFEDDILTC